MTPLYNTNADAEWEVDPADWRNLPDSEPTEDDEDVPASKYLVDVLGFDPDEEDWGDVTDNAFCPTGEGGGVDPTCSPGGGSKVKVDTSKVNHHSLTMTSLKYFGVRPSKYGELVGAQSGAVVHVESMHVAQSEYGETVITLRVVHPDYEAVRELRVGVYDGAKVLYNSSIEIDSGKAGKGLGTKIFSEQVNSAVAHGFDRIETSAIGSKEGVNGYYTWARFGYDAKLRRETLKGAQEVVPGATHISDLMRTQEGRSWWKENGGGFEGTFDLKEGSLSRKVLDAYVKAKANRAAP